METIGDGIISEIKPCKGKLPADRIRDAVPAILEALEAAHKRLSQLIPSGYSDDDMYLFGQIESAIAAAGGK